MKSVSIIIGFCLLVGGCLYVADWSIKREEAARLAVEEQVRQEQERRAAEQEAEAHAEQEAKAKAAADALAKLQAEERENLKQGALNFARKCVVMALKNPSDAEFSDSFEFELSASDRAALVSSTVTSADSARARSTQSWQVRMTLESNQWHQEFCKINGKIVFLASADIQSAQEAETAAKAAAERAAREERKLAEAALAKEAAEKNRATAAAAGYLKIAKNLQLHENEDAARKWFKRIIEQYPDTEAATEARLLLGEASIAASGAAPREKRTWSEKTGTRKIDAEFVDFKDGIVRLKLEAGKIVALPIDRLSEADQQFIREATP